jgi:aerobic-type carbon monoxide dehydrogenase small subunit (CoxS/CutS family)
MASKITLTVNGREQSVSGPPERLLLDVLREDLQLTGTKYGCGEGECGACTVLLDGRPVHACRTEIGAAAGKTVVTVEGLAKGEVLHPVQQAFLDEGAFQCGYCTPGMVMAVVALLDFKPKPTDAEILAAMNGHICRCNGYPKILRAVHRAAGQLAEVKP